MNEDRLSALGRWFVLHFVLDLLVAIPLFLFPEVILGWVGLSGVNIVLARMVAAALFGIGLESWWGRKASAGHFVGMLRLKIVWSVVVVFALLFGLIQRQIEVVVGLLVLGLFFGFNLVWVYWWLRLRKS